MSAADVREEPGPSAGGPGARIDRGVDGEPRRRSLIEAFLALAVAALILAAATLAGSGAGWLFDAWAQIGTARAWKPGEIEALTTARLAVFLLIFQATVIVLTIGAAAAFGRGRERLLPVGLPRGGGRAMTVSVVALLILAALYGATVFFVDRRALLTDVQPFVELMKARTWWLMLIAAAAGAPLAEEFLFRGFLYGVLRRSVAGLPGAGLVSAFVWSCLHAAYSLYGMAAIFLIGLYLAYVREKTESLVTPIVCHAIYNGTVVAVLSSAPDTVFKLS